MPNDFQKTVNLKSGQRKKAGAQIERVYGEDAQAGEQKFNKPKIRQVNEPLFKRLVILLAIIAVLIVVYFLFIKKDENQQDISNWYAIKLVNEEIYYGQVEDTASDPVVIENVYYNYDQQKGNKEITETGSLRLVKRGQETHGPAGTMDIIRSQILYMEPLKEDSKVLEAILSYER